MVSSLVSSTKLGHLLAAAFTLAFASEGSVPDSYKILFWIGAGASFAVGIVRILFPESEQFLQAKKEGKRGRRTKKFIAEAGVVLRTQLVLIIYACVLMALFNFLSHTTQDLYPTFLISGKGLTRADSARGSIYAKVGAIVGGAVIGYLSQSLGRRRAIVFACVCTAALIPVWALPESKAGLAAGSFFLQFMVQGACGVIPVHLNELSAPQFRAAFPGIAYQIGNAISSPAAEIVTAISEQNFVTYKGKEVEAFGPTMGVATTIITISLAFWTAVGKEHRGSHFGVAQAAGCSDEPDAAGSTRAKDVEDGHSNEKGSVEIVEDVTPRSTKALFFV